jgi:16S rRNA (uracil1498-N3)-methyltransferase
MSLLEWPRRVAALAQLRVDDPSDPVLAASDRHHLHHVLRAREGEEVVVTDGVGSWSICEVRGDSLARVTPVHLDPPTLPSTIYLAPLKGDRSESTVVKATELGVSRVVPLVSRHVVVRFQGEARDKIVTRWRRLAQETSGQCRRTYDLVVDNPLDVSDVPDDVAIADFGGEGAWTGVRSVAIGPEGGWGVDEWDEHRRRLSLGPTVLRADTAGVVAAALLAYGAGGWGFALDGSSAR